MDPTKMVIAIVVVGVSIFAGTIWYLEQPPAPPKPAPGPVAVKEIPKPAPLPEPEPVVEEPKESPAVTGMRKAMLTCLEIIRETDPEDILFFGYDKIDNFRRIQAKESAKTYDDPIELYLHAPDGERPALMMRLNHRGRDILGLQSAKVVVGDYSEEIPLEEVSTKAKSGVFIESAVVDISQNGPLILALSTRKRLDPIVIRFRGRDEVEDKKPQAGTMKNVAAVMAVFLGLQIPDGQDILAAHKKRVLEDADK